MEVMNLANKKKKGITRWIFPLILVLAAVAIGIPYVLPSREAGYAQGVAYIGDISTTFSFTGNITAPRYQTIYAPAAATVRDVYVQANDTVRTGDRLCKLSTGELIKADISGEVVRLNMQKDDVVVSGAELITIMDVGNLEVTISIDEYDIGSVSIGKQVDVIINALGITCPGTIKSLDKDATTDKSLAVYSAVVSIDAPEQAFPGMQVEVKMQGQSAESVVLLSAEVLQFDELNRAYVLIRGGDDSHQRTYVETGVNDGSNVEIRAGITNGTVVYYPSKNNEVTAGMTMGRPPMGGGGMPGGQGSPMGGGRGE